MGGFRGGTAGQPCAPVSHLELPAGGRRSTSGNLRMIHPPPKLSGYNMSRRQRTFAPDLLERATNRRAEFGGRLYERCSTIRRPSPDRTRNRPDRARHGHGVGT